MVEASGFSSGRNKQTNKNTHARQRITRHAVICTSANDSTLAGPGSSGDPHTREHPPTRTPHPHLPAPETLPRFLNFQGGSFQEAQRRAAAATPGPQPLSLTDRFCGPVARPGSCKTASPDNGELPLAQLSTAATPSPVCPPGGAAVQYREEAGGRWPSSAVALLLRRCPSPAVADIHHHPPVRGVPRGGGKHLARAVR